MKSSGLFLLPLVLLACTIPLPPPTAADSIGQLKAACNAACGESRTVTVFVPAGASLYATDEAVCIRQGRKLFCGTCGCGLYGLTPGEIVPAGPAKNVTCAFTDEGDALIVAC